MKKILLYFSLSLMIASLNTGCGTLSTRVENQIELVGSELTEVPVTVEEVDLRVARGLGEINGFRIANPEGYVDDDAMSCELLLMNVAIISSVAGDPLVLDKLVISYPMVNFEKNKQGGSNLKDLAVNTKKNLDKADQKSAKEEPASEETPEEPFRIKIKELIIEGPTLNVRTVDGTIRSAILPSIKLEDVGGEDGTTPGGLGIVVVGAMAGEMLKQVVARELIERAGQIQEALSTDNILWFINNRLILSPEQQEKIRPIIENLSEALIATIDVWVGQDYLDLDVLYEELTPVWEDFRTRIKTILDGSQYADINELIVKLEDNAIEIIRFAVVQQISMRLGMTPEQVQLLRPILREHLVNLSIQLREFVANADWSFEKFVATYEEVGAVLRERLTDKLTSEQIKELEKLQQEILDQIQTALAARGRIKEIL